MKDQKTIPNQPDPEKDPFMNKSVGVALKGPEWMFLMGFLHHCCTDEETIKSLFEDQEQYNEIAFILRSIQRQVLLIQDKIEKPTEEGFAKKILSFKNKLVGPDGTPLS